MPPKVGVICIDGWIKLHRKLLENPIMKQAGMLQLWVYCLLKANHEPGKAHFGKDDIDVSPGQFVTGRFKLSDALGEKPSTIYKRISALQRSGFLNIKSNNKNSLITIVNWHLYQAAELESSSKSNNKVTTKEQQSSTNKNDKNIRIKEEEEEGSVFRFFNENISPISPHQAEVISQYLDDGIEATLILEVLKDSIGKREKWTWIKKVLENSLVAGIKTLLQYQAKKKEAQEERITKTQKVKTQTKEDGIQKSLEIAERLKAQGVQFDDE